MEFFKQLRSRHLVQIVISYVAGGWIALQVVNQFVERGMLGEFAFQLAFIVYACGIPAALIVGWYHGEKGAQKAPRREIFLLAGVALLTLALSGGSVSTYMQERAALAAAAESEMDLRRIAVVYFEDFTSDHRLGYLADAFTEDLITELSRVNGLDVVSRRGTVQFRDAGITPDSVGRILDAGTVVAGTIEELGDRIRIGLRVIDSSAGTDFGRRASIEVSATDASAARTELAAEVANLLRRQIGDEIQLRRTQRMAADANAWTQLQRSERARKDAEALLHAGTEVQIADAFDAASQLAEQAAQLAPEWIEPLLLQSEIAYRRSRLAQTVPERLSWADRSIASADHALALDPNHAGGLEIRGVARYWKYLQQAVGDPAQAQRLRADAVSDLEAAVRLEPRALAYYALSHAYIATDQTASLIAAQQAYEADEFLDEANGILWRLFTGHYDAEQFSAANRWCTQGLKRFPDDYRFSNCSLLMLSTGFVTADTIEARALAERVVQTAPPGVADYQRLQSQMFLAGVLARAGNAESALALLDATRRDVTAASDPGQELLTVEAAMRTMAGDREGAVALLRRYAAVDPEASYERHWWWRDLQGVPGLPAPTQTVSN